MNLSIILAFSVLSSSTNASMIRQTTTTKMQTKETNETTMESVKNEMDLDSIIISAIFPSDYEGTTSIASDGDQVSNSTSTPAEVSTTSLTTSTLKSPPTTADDQDGYDTEATEGYTELSVESSSVNTVQELYDAKERLSLLEARVELLEDVNLVWWHNFREMGALLPKKSWKKIEMGQP